MTLNRCIAQSVTVHPHKPRTGNLISWSKNGFIAYISPALASKNSVFLTHIESVDGWGWRLAPTESIKIDKNAPHALSMVSWSDLNTDLAVADTHGNFYILLAGVGLVEPPKYQPSEADSASSSTLEKDAPPPPVSPSYELTSYNHMEMIYRDVVSDKKVSYISESTCATSIVAFKWLNIDKPQATNLPATRGEQANDWQYPAAHYPAYGAAHPIATKEACVALRRNGEFIMYYQGEHKVEYHKMTCQIEDAFLNISMASFGFSHDKNIYLTVYDTLLGKIRVYVIVPDWGFLVESAKKQKQDPHYHTPLQAQLGPSILVVKVHEMCPVAMLSDSSSPSGLAVSSENKENGCVRLCALASIDMVSANGAPGSVLDLFITYHTRKGIDGVPSSSVYRYNLVPDQECILDVFFDLGTRKGITPASPAQNAMSLALQSSITRLGTVESISSLNSEPFFMIAYQEGHIDIFDRHTMKLVSHPDTDDDAPTPRTISSHCDAGFDFPLFSGEALPLVMALSPTSSSIVSFDLEDSAPILQLHIFEKNRYKSITPENMSLSIAGLAHRHAYCCFSNTCSDDLIVLMEHEIQRIANLMQLNGQSQSSITATLNKFVDMLLIESHKAVNFHLDAFSKELVDKLLSNPPLQKLLSLQLAVKEFGLTTPNDSTRDVAWTILNLRSASFGVMFSLSSIYRQVSKKKPIEDSLSDSIARGECIISLIGNMKWLADLMIYLNQELMELSFNATGTKNSCLTIDNALVVPLLLGKVPRLFLMYALSSLGKTNDILKKLSKDLAEANKLFTPMRESLNRCFAICNNIPLSLSNFEVFLRECDSLITNENNALFAGKDKSVSLSHQRDLVCRGTISESDKSIAARIIEKHAATMSRDPKVSDVYFYDTEWLQLGINWHSKNPNRTLVQETILPRPTNAHSLNNCRLQYSRDTFIDCLRKILITSKPPGKSKNNNSTSSDKGSRMRKCVRCRSVSLVSDPIVFDPPSAIGLWTMVFQRTCICGSAWTNCEVR